MDKEEIFRLYCECILSEASKRQGEIRQSIGDGSPNTLYIGGGTPSVLPLSVLADISSKIKDILGVYDFEEMTVEVNPDDIVRRGIPYVESLLEMGVTRISMGVQSLDDGILRWMGRRHTSQDAIKAVEIIREAGCRNLSLDLIFGVPGMDEKKWRDTLETIVSFHPQHISAYQLGIDEGSPLGKLVESGEIKEMDEEQCALQYGILCAILRDEGFRHYEVSNFAKAGFEAAHNAAYWRRVPYVGLGPGAHSLTRDGERCWNSQSFPSYTQEKEKLSDEEIRIEKIMLSLRTDMGLEESYLNKTVEDRLLEEGALEKMPEGRVRIPESRFFVSDEIIRELI